MQLFYEFIESEKSSFYSQQHYHQQYAELSSSSHEAFFSATIQKMINPDLLFWLTLSLFCIFHFINIC